MGQPCSWVELAWGDDEGGGIGSEDAGCGFPSKRIDVDDAINHPVFAKVRK